VFVCVVVDAANNLGDPPPISYFEFYNPSLDSLDLLAEYYTWQNPQAHSQAPRSSLVFISSCGSV